MPQHIAVQEHLLPGDTILHKWDRARRMGFDGIELRGDGASIAARLPELRAARAAGAVFPSICTISDRFIGDFDADRRAEAVASMKTLLSVIAELGGRGAITPAAFGMHSSVLPPFEAPRNAGGDSAALLDTLGQLGRHAHAEGSLVLLEPLNRYEDHMLNGLGQGTRLIEALGEPSVRLMADLFHMNIEEADSAAAIDAAMPHVAHLHLADSNRLEPGQGHVDFAAVFAVLARHGFAGACALECRLSDAAERSLPATLAFLRRAGG